MIRLNATKYLRPCERIASRDWLPKFVTMPKGTETSGLPFSLASFPHVDGVLAAFDDPSIRRISLQWGSRLGKTTTCFSLMAKVAGTNPRNMMFGSATKEACVRAIGSRLYPILESTEGIKHQLPPESRRSKLHVRLESCQVFVGWSGSATSLADVGAFFGVGNEVDKWDPSASGEADPLKLFINRFKGFPDHKIIFESTPRIKGRSRIETLLQESNQHRRYVPCPHCGEFQILVKGDANTPGGFRWDRDANGNSEPDVAFQTAYYECRHCEGKIENHHRTIMLRDGVWVPNGCTIDSLGEIHGRAVKHGSDSVGFGPLASWYALTETWGNFARVWIQAQKRPRDLQDVVNSYMGETWETKKTKSTPEMVGERLAGKLPRGFVPIGSRFITITIDQQAADGGFVKWVALSHGEHEQSWLIDYGAARSLADLWEPIIRKAWTCEDGGLAMTSVLTAIDSGYDTKRTYEFCNAHVGTIACKGSSTDFGLPYKLVTLKDGIIDEQPLFHVNTDYWETDLQCCLDERLPGEKNSLTLCINACHDLDFLTELCNATLGDKIDSRGNLRMLWIKKDESGANDFRDAIRYGKALGKMWVESQGLPGRVAGNAAVVAKKQAEEQASGFVRTPQEQSSGGWIRRRGSN